MPGSPSTSTCGAKTYSALHPSPPKPPGVPAALERAGAPIDQLRPCEDHGRDGTRLAGCLKLYVPLPAGPWGIVLQLARDQHGALLAVLAFGLRHPPTPRRSSVYQLAHQRLHSKA